MPERNERLRFEQEPIPLFRAIGKVEDPNGNEFQVIATGPKDQVGEFWKARTLDVVIRPLGEEQAEQADVSEEGPPPEEQARQEEPPEYEELPEPTEEELAESLVIEVKPTVVKTEPPYVLHFEDDPKLKFPKSRYYYFTDHEEAYIKCTSNEGNADLYLHEKKCGPEGCHWKWRCSSTKTSAVDKCRRKKEYTGEWRVRVKAVTDCDFTLTGDLYVA